MSFQTGEGGEGTDTLSLLRSSSKFSTTRETLPPNLRGRRMFQHLGELVTIMVYPRGSLRYFKYGPALRANEVVTSGLAKAA